MATKELAFNSKIKSLKEYLNQITSFNQPPPPGTDVANTVKYFTNILLNILKDAPNIEGERFYGAKYAKCNLKLTLFPTLNYSGLYDVVSGLLPVVHLITISQDAIMESILQLVACLVPFLTWDQLIQLPYKLCLCLPMALPAQHKDIVWVLSVYLLPNTLGREVDGNLLTTEAISGMLMLILQHCTDPKLHSMFVEALLPLKQHLYKDIFTVIAYGPPNTKIPAVKLLFHYWPQLHHLLGQSTLTESYTVTPWHVPICQRVNCINKSARPSASKMCTHPNMCAAECHLPPPVFICVDCYDTYGMRPYDSSFTDIIMPACDISLVCSNKNCTIPNCRAVAVCASMDCVKMNRFRPVSLCALCNTARHPGTCGHVQESIHNLWTLEPETQSYVVDAIVNLLREAEPSNDSMIEAALQPIMDHSCDFQAVRDPIHSRYGILLLKELCKPRRGLSVDALGKLLGMLFHWFQCTGSTHHPVATEMLEKLKTEFMTEWLQEVKKSYYEVILSTLLPHPPDFAKVGGQWERLSSRTEQIKEGLEKLIMLGPYDIVTYEVWDYIMPYWLESIRTELTLKEREEIKVLLRQTFDIEMSPLPFLLDKMYHFIDERFEAVDPQIQEQGLQWLQILTSVDIAIPFVLLLKMFRDGTTCLLNATEGPAQCDLRTVTQVKLNCFILMLDILLKQSELSRVPPHAGVTQNKSKEMFILLDEMIRCIRSVEHKTVCQTGGGDCTTCQHLTVFHQLAFNLLRIICPRLESSLPILDLKQLALQKPAQPVVNESVGSEEGDGQAQPVIHTLFVTLLQVLEGDHDVDVGFYIANSLKSLFVHGQCLNLVHKSHPVKIEEFLQQQFIPMMWKLLDSKLSRTSKICVLMLFHAVALGDGNKYFWTIVNADCTHKNWQIRYAAADKIRMIWENSNANFLSKNQIVMTSLAHVFCQYVTLLHDPDQNVAQRASLQLKLLGETALQAIVKCMAVQFDAVVKDRQIILYKLAILQNSVPDRKVFTWTFFLSRLQQLFVEAELSNSTDSSTGRGPLLRLSHGQNLDQMMKIAQFAAMRCDSISSIREQSGVYEKSHTSISSLSAGMSRDRKNSVSQFIKQKTRKKPGQSQSDHSLQDWLAITRESLQDLSYLHRMLARPPRRDDVMPELGSENGKIIKTLWKAIETDKLDHSVLHQLVTCVVKFMSTASTPTEELVLAKQQGTVEHLFYLIGYAEGRFYVQPSQLRSSPVIEAILVNLPTFLDSNVEMGQKLLTDCLNILKFTGSPQKYASDHQAADYTLIHLPPALTKHWIQSLLIILYKYHYSNNSELSPSVNYLVRIVLNTLAAIPHKCKKRKDSDSDSHSEVQGVLPGFSANGTCEEKAEMSGLGRSSSSASTPGDLGRMRNHTGGSTAGLLSGASAVIHEEEEHEIPSQAIGSSRRATVDPTDIGALLSNPQQQNSPVLPASLSKLKQSSSQSSPSLSKKQATSNSKPKKLQRQYSIDVVSQTNSIGNASFKQSIPQSKTLDDIKADDFLSALENPQKVSSNAKSAGTPSASPVISGSDRQQQASTASAADNMKPPSLAMGSSAAKYEASSYESPDTKRGSESSKLIGSVLSMMKRQGSKSNLQDSFNSTDDDKSAIIQSAAAATDFMARSKRGQNLAKSSIDGSELGDRSRGMSYSSGMASNVQLLTANRKFNCVDCGRAVEEYSEEIIVLCIVSAETYLNHDMNQAASMVYEMIHSISNIATSNIYTWQSSERAVFIPGNVASSALQFLRCTLHHLHPFSIMSALLLYSDDSKMFKTIVTALTDFQELNSVQALVTALENINSKDEMNKPIQLLENLNVYLQSLSMDTSNNQDWPKVIDQLDLFFRKLPTLLPESPTDLSILLMLMNTILKLPVITTHKGDRMVETYSKVLSSALQTHSFNMLQLAKLCQLCFRTFSRDRDKTILSRMIVNELIQVLKYKSSLPECNVLMLLEIVCMDCGSTLLPTYITNEIPSQLSSDMIIDTGIMDILRLYLHDCIEFVSDLHTLLKLKAHLKPTCLHEDTFGGLLKTGISQIVALEMSKVLQQEAKATQKVIPWLYNQPNTIQRGPKEFLESVDHVRFLCWLYIGALTHYAVAENVLSTKCQPVPLDDANNLSVIVMSIMTGFVEYSAASVEFMSSLFYGFILCQVWTVYCETLTVEGLEREPEEQMDITQIVYDFWAKVTPTILNLMSHTKVLSEMVNLHVLSLMETLQECQSSVLVKLFPLWRLLLYSNHNKLPTNMLVRLQTLENWQPSDKKKINKAVLFDWVKKVQFKLAQIEVQSSTAVKFLAI